MTDLLDEITFCDECPYSGEPNGCNREEGICKAHESYFDLVEENADLHERLEEAVVNKCVYYINSVWNDATMTRKDEVCQGAIDYACDNFVEIAGLVLKWKEIYFTREAAESRLAEMKGGEE